MDKNKKTESSLVNECIKAYRGTGEETDVQGSYTGIYRGIPVKGAPLYTAYDGIMAAEDAVPVQDADDL